MPKKPGAPDTRVLYPAEVLEVVSFVSTDYTPDFVWKGKPCCVQEHEGRRVYAPDDNGVLFEMAREGRLSDPFATVGFRDTPTGSIGLACPVCVNLIVGLGRGES